VNNGEYQYLTVDVLNLGNKYTFDTVKGMAWQLSAQLLLSRAFFVASFVSAVVSVYVRPVVVIGSTAVRMILSEPQMDSGIRTIEQGNEGARISTSFDAAKVCMTQPSYQCPSYFTVTQL
jgi:hypothetical protein